MNLVRAGSAVLSLICVAHVLSGAAFAQSAIEAPPGPQPAAPAEAPAPRPSAVTVRLQYTGEAAVNPIGGLHNGATYLNSVDAQVRLDTHRAGGWEGGKFLLEGVYANASSINRRYVGAVQDPSPVDTNQGVLLRLYQAYYEQRVGRTSILFGIYDIETEFGVTRPMDMFMNGAYAWNAALDVSGRNGPSTYPNTALGLRVRQPIGKEWTVWAAVLDGVPETIHHPKSNAVAISGTSGAFLIGEVNYRPTRTTELLAGAWNYTGKFDAFTQTNADGTARQLSGSRGLYFGGNTRLHSVAPNRGLDAFAMLGVAGARTNEVAASLNLGLTYSGPFEARPDDKFGLALGAVQASDAFRRGEAAAGNRTTQYEKNVEMSYRAPINDWLTVQPDVQYWRHPGFDARRKDDFLFILHFEVGHSFSL